MFIESKYTDYVYNTIIFFTIVYIHIYFENKPMGSRALQAKHINIRLHKITN